MTMIRQCAWAITAMLGLVVINAAPLSAQENADERVSAPSPSQSAKASEKGDKSPCSDVATTVEMNECAADGLRRAEERQAQYLAAAFDHYHDKPDVLAKIRASQSAFESYRDAECDGVYERWKSGSIRGAMSLACRISLTDHRTHTIWSNWLTFMLIDPLLPEPVPTR